MGSGHDEIPAAATYEDWVQIVRNLTGTVRSALEYRQLRSKSSAEIARTILQAVGCSEARAMVPPNSIPAVVYGVWLDGHSQHEPVYIGQTRDAARRLWDLPIGESHHLANTMHLIDALQRHSI